MGFKKRIQRAWILLGSLGFLALSSVAMEEQGDPQALYAPHEKDGRFFNPWEPFDRPSLWDFFRWRLSGNPYGKGEHPPVAVIPNDGEYLAGVEHSATITWVGHATFAIHDGDDVFLTDPHFGKRALLPMRAVPPGLPLKSIPQDAFAVISHNHYDHLDEYSVKNLPETMNWFVPLGLAQWFRDQGQPRVVELDWWQSAQHGRFTITCLPSQHWSRRIGQGEDETLWCSWLVDSGDFKYYFAGDTGYFPGFKEFGARMGKIDIAMLPIGAYAPRWFMGYQHLDPDQAYQAFLDLEARYFLPMHWGTFRLTDEPLDLPPKALAEAVLARGKPDPRIKLFSVGERWKVPERQ